MPTVREPQDHKPARKKATAKKTTAKKTTARQRAPQRASTPSETAASEPVDQTAGPRAEVETEETGWIQIPLGDDVFRICPPEQWRQSTNDALSDGLVNDWAADVMPAADYRRWLDLDPTNAEFASFMETMGEEVGMSLGESGPSNRLLRRMRRR